jgi:bisphosphoglycerate-independent phosphoglycerate mutase (AlkP superfamily)
VNLLPQGILADVAPTILAMMKIDKPDLMVGHNLFNF